MTWTAPTDDVIFQEGVFMYSYECSGTVIAGETVYPVGTMKVKAAGTAQWAKVVGVAAYGQTDGKMIGVYGPGNIVRGCVSGTAVAVGDPLMPTASGWIDATTHPSGIAIALETQATDTGQLRVLLK
jgi:hypothetical protein